MKSFGAPLGLAAFLCGSLVAQTAMAAEDEWDGGYARKAERRSGFAAAFDLGFGLGRATGYPNEISKIDDPEFESTTGAAFGSTWSIWAGGALRDWFTVGLGLMTLGAASKDIKAGSSAFILHVETFPLWSLGGPLRDLALYTHFGAGGLKITGGPEEADGGFMSVLGGGLSYELWRPGHFAIGPVLEGSYLYSESGEVFGVFAGVRSSFYGGP
ncbi:MAG TPA: hypothetical protein VG937_37585 [Polyangiaceae bacterium]|nr:hypothetical protein [Polyangiaceae bacterium]